MMKSTHTGKKKHQVVALLSLSLSASRWPWNQRIQDNWIRIPISKEDGTKPVECKYSTALATDQSLLRTELQTSQWVLILIKQLITISHVQPEGRKLQETPLSFRSNPIFSIKFDLSIKSNLFDQIRSFLSNSIFSIKFDLFHQVWSLLSFRLNPIFSIKFDLFYQIWSLLSNSDLFDQIRSFRSNPIFSIKFDVFDFSSHDIGTWVSLLGT